MDEKTFGRVNSSNSIDNRLFILFSPAPRRMPVLPSKEIEIPDPPTLPQPPLPLSKATIWFPLLFSISAFIPLFLFGANTYALVYMVPALGSLIYPIIMHGQHKKQVQNCEIEKKRLIEIYYQKLNKEIWSELNSLTEKQRIILVDREPDFSIRLEWVKKAKDRLWERQPEHEDFLQARIGIGNIANNVKIKAPKTPAIFQNTEQKQFYDQIDKVLSNFAVISNVPVTISLSEDNIIGIAGKSEIIHSIIRSLIIYLASSHSPNQLRLILFTEQELLKFWSWIRWLPHLRRELEDIELMLAFTKESIQDISKELNKIWMERTADPFKTEKKSLLPHYLFIVDTSPDNLPQELRAISEISKKGASFIFLNSSFQDLPSQCRTIIQANQEEMPIIIKNSQQSSFIPDNIELFDAEKFARYLSAYRLKGLEKPKELGANYRLLDILNIINLDAQDIANKWMKNKSYDSLKASIGVGEDDKEFIVDLSQKGQGPHGLIGGTTGCGKSEFLLTLISSLAMNYHPHDLNFLVVDYKGGVTSQMITDLPHLVGIITNLHGSNAERAHIALEAEIKRRERLFTEANVREIEDYQMRYYENKVTEPIARLVIIVDEFAELKMEQPQFLSNLIQLSRVGRSFGIHLLLATQKPGGTVQGEIWANSNFRICFCVASPEDSNEMIHRPDAFYLKNKGRAYLQVGGNLPALFQTARVTTKYDPDSGRSYLSQCRVSEIEINGKRKPIWPASSSKVKDKKSVRLDIYEIVEQIKMAAHLNGIQKLKGPWLPPLPKEIFLDDLLAEEGYKGYSSGIWQDTMEYLQIIIGKYDDLINQQQPLLKIDLTKSHLLICGMPATGKSTLLQTILTSLARKYTPDIIQFYIIDFGARNLNIFEALPHTGSVIQGYEEEKLSIFLNWLEELIALRGKVQFRKPTPPYGTGNLLQREDAQAAIALVINNFTEFKKNYPDAIALIEKIGRLGTGLGIHLILTIDLPLALPISLLNNITYKIIFQLSDKADYAAIIGQKLDTPFTPAPGRAIWFAGGKPYECQIALPSANSETQARNSMLKTIFDEMQKEWKGSLPYPIKLLPAEIKLTEAYKELEPQIDALKPKSIAVPIGYAQFPYQPLFIDLIKDGPHFLITGSRQSGKTNFLRCFSFMIDKIYERDKVQIYVIDSIRKSLKDLKGLPQIKFYADQDETTEALILQLDEFFTKRKQESSIDPHNRYTILLIDDYDLFVHQQFKKKLADMGRNYYPLGFSIIIAMPCSEIYRGLDILREVVLNSSSGLLLCPSTGDDLQSFRLSLSLAPQIKGMTKGKGFYILHGQNKGIIQTFLA